MYMEMGYVRVDVLEKNQHSCGCINICKVHKGYTILIEASNGFCGSLQFQLNVIFKLMID